MSEIVNRARALRPVIEQLAEAHLDDTQALENTELFPSWSGDSVEYELGFRVRYEGQLYKCIGSSSHISQPSWNPADATSIWVRVDDPSIEFPEWVQPLGSEDAYRIGAKVSHNNKHWISTIDFNVYEPGVYGWNEVV